ISHVIKLRGCKVNSKYLNDSILEYCKNSDDSIVKSANEMVHHCLDIDDKIPNEHSWKFTSESSIKEQLKGVGSPNELNNIYWKDQVSNVEAYSIMTLWRGIELVRSCLNGLNNAETISPAISSRSLLELSTVFLLNANLLHKNFSEVKLSNSQVVISTDIEAFVVKMIWGTRYDDPEPHLLQTNIMTSLKRLSKNPAATDLMPTYEFLCDIAHPSFIGNTSYWSHVDSVNDDGSENRVISRSVTRYTNTEILDKTLWALAWSSACIRNAFDIMTEANTLILDQLQNG
ncbi:hypothetical protein ACE34V_004822, partial [Vibrio alginolyticus]